jgi:DNA-directed RNA polymerase specialized sigma24 family protein
MKLGVAHLLEGSVRKSGDMIRVSAELIDTADGSAQWSEHYDRPYKDLFALQDEITRAVAGALKTKLLQVEHAAAQLPIAGDKELVALDDALDELTRIDDRQGKIVQMKSFGGLSAPDISQVLGVSLATVEREWTTARIWLPCEMSRAASP